MGYYGFFIIESIPSIKDCLIGLNTEKVNQNVYIVIYFSENLPDKL